MTGQGFLMSCIIIYMGARILHCALFRQADQFPSTHLIPDLICEYCATHLSLPPRHSSFFGPVLFHLLSLILIGIKSTLSTPQTAVHQNNIDFTFIDTSELSQWAVRIRSLSQHLNHLNHNYHTDGGHSTKYPENINNNVLLIIIYAQYLLFPPFLCDWLHSSVPSLFPPPPSHIDYRKIPIRGGVGEVGLRTPTHRHLFQILQVAAHNRVQTYSQHVNI